MANQKVTVLLALMVTSFLVGIFGQYYYPGVKFSPVDLWTLPLFPALLFAWYRIDSNQKAYRRTPWLDIAVVGISAIALPYYLFRTRGFKGGLVATVVSVLLILCSAFLTMLGKYGAYYGFQH